VTLADLDDYAESVAAWHQGQRQGRPRGAKNRA
jgi:hypothetical protein